MLNPEEEQELKEIIVALPSHLFALGLHADKIAALEAKAKAFDALILRVEALELDRHERETVETERNERGR